MSCLGSSLHKDVDVCQRPCACCCAPGVADGVLSAAHLLQLLAAHSSSWVACSLD